MVLSLFPNPAERTPGDRNDAGTLTTDPLGVSSCRATIGEASLRRIVTILVLMVLLAGCSGGRDSADSITTPPPATTQAAASGEIDASFDVAGHKLHLRCEGKGSSGSPTVVYLHGLGGDGSDVEPISSPLAGRVRAAPTTG
jgi:hypothetical protein